MAAISSRTHEQFIETINNSVSIELMDKGFQYDLKQLEQLFGAYHEQVTAIHRLISQYNNMQRRLRVDLRNYQIKQKKQLEMQTENKNSNG